MKNYKENVFSENTNEINQIKSKREKKRFSIPPLVT